MSTAGAGEARRSTAEVHRRRCELRLARVAVEPLRQVPLDPDPLTVLAAAFAEVRPELDEDASVVVDLLAVSTAKRWRVRRRLANRARDHDGMRGAGESLARAVDQTLAELGLGSGGGGRPGQLRRDPVDMVGQRQGMRELASKVEPGQAMFEAQVLLHTRARYRERANGLMRALLGAFEIFASANNLRVSGVDLGMAFLGSDLPGRRRWFDYRMRTGYFRPARVRGGNIVTDTEIAGLLKPFTARCPAENVWRAGPYLPPPPADLAEYRHRRGVLPLGRIVREDGATRLVGMRTEEYLFGALCGRAGQGKTTSALGQFLHMALVEHQGALFFDPHVDALARLRPYLTAPGVRERVVELNLAERRFDAGHVGWNLLSMFDVEGRRIGEERLADRAYAVIDSFCIAAGWTSKNAARSTAMLTNAVTALLHIALQLPKELQPTIFTIPTLLTDEEFRAAVVARLPAHLQGYWTSTFDVSGTSPICQLVSRLQANPTVRATFGSPVSTFDPRAAMDTSAIILAASPSVGDDLVCSLIMQGLIDAARSRRDTAEQHRRLSWWWMDEAQIWDREALRGSALSMMLREIRKYGCRVTPMTQSPFAFCDSTIDALTTNASMFATYATAPKAAKFFDGQWGDVNASRAVMALPKYELIAQFTHHGERVGPLRVHGVSETELFGEHHHPELEAELVAAIDASCRPRTIRDTLTAINAHDTLILQALRGRPPGGGDAPGPRPRKPNGGGGFPIRPRGHTPGGENGLFEVD